MMRSGGAKVPNKTPHRKNHAKNKNVLKKKKRKSWHARKKN